MYKHTGEAETMKRIAINDKYLLMISEHAERLADIIEKRTGHRPNIEKVMTDNSQPDVGFGLINKEGVKQ